MPGTIWQKNEYFDARKAIVWIDPLDGTKDFTLGNLSAVTVMIGLAVDGIPMAGIVHNPFKTNKNDGKGITVFGSVAHGAFKIDFDASSSARSDPESLPPFSLTETFSDKYNISVAASLNHFSPDMQTILEKMEPVEIVRLGGAGNKVNRIALGEVDSYV